MRVEDEKEKERNFESESEKIREGERKILQRESFIKNKKIGGSFKT